MLTIGQSLEVYGDLLSKSVLISQLLLRHRILFPSPYNCAKLYTFSFVAFQSLR